MSHILYEHDNCRLYAKDPQSISARYFISEKSNRLRRLQISASFGCDLEALEGYAFCKKVREVLDRASDHGTPGYYEVKL